MSHLGDHFADDCVARLNDPHRDYFALPETPQAQTLVCEKCPHCLFICFLTANEASAYWQSFVFCFLNKKGGSLRVFDPFRRTDRHFANLRYRMNVCNWAKADDHRGWPAAGKALHVTLILPSRRTPPPHLHTDLMVALDADLPVDL